MIRVLKEALCQVEGVGSLKEALAAIARERPDVIVASIEPGGGADVVRQLRNAGDAHILALIDGDRRPWDIPTLLAAGADGVMRAPIAEAELLARVKQSPRRMISRAQRMAAPALDRSAAAVVSGLQAWQNMGALAVNDIVQMVGEPLRVCDRAPSGFAGGLRGATIPMSLASANIEAHVSVVTDENGRHWLGRRLLGEERASEASLDDVLRELANVAGGALKRAALAESVILTTGLPLSNHAVRLTGHGVRCWTVTLEDGVERIAVVGELHHVETRRVPASGLREGMVLTCDLRSANGQLLVTAGSRLTNTTATRLAKLLGSRIFVEVACAA
jgi:CheY-like chemotaxis protein